MELLATINAQVNIFLIMCLLFQMAIIMIIQQKHAQAVVLQIAIFALITILANLA